MANPQGYSGSICENSCTWFFSLQQSIRTLSGESSFRPMTSKSFPSDVGSFDLCKVRGRSGFKSFAAQIPYTLFAEIPAARTVLRELHRSQPIRGVVTCLRTRCATLRSREGLLHRSGLSTKSSQSLNQNTLAPTSDQTKSKSKSGQPTDLDPNVTLGGSQNDSGWPTVPLADVLIERAGSVRQVLLVLGRFW